MANFLHGDSVPPATIIRELRAECDEWKLWALAELGRAETELATVDVTDLRRELAARVRRAPIIIKLSGEG
jgi:hypothetical protein